MKTAEALSLKVAFLSLVHGIDAAIGVAARLANRLAAQGILEELTPWKRELEEACADLDAFLKTEKDGGNV